MDRQISDSSSSFLWGCVGQIIIFKHYLHLRINQNRLGKQDLMSQKDHQASEEQEVSLGKDDSVHLSVNMENAPRDAGDHSPCKSPSAQTKLTCNSIQSPTE